MADLSPEDVLDPAGKVLPSMFPTDDAAQLELRVQAYIDDAYAKPVVAAIVDDDDRWDAAEAWVYFRVFDAITNRMMNTALKADIRDQGSREFSVQQLAHFSRLKDEYASLFGSLTATSVTNVPDKQSQSLPTGITW